MRNVMPMQRAILSTLGAYIAACAAFAQPAPPTPPTAPTPGAAGVRAIVSIAPLKSLVDPFVAAASGGPESFAVDILIPPGVSEHGYEIPPAKLATLAKADVVVYVGLGLEPQVEDFLKDHPSPTRRAVEFAKAAGIAEAGGHKHDHDHDHDHAHDQDPHLWLDPPLVLKLVPAVRQAVEQAAAAKSGGALAPEIRARLDAAEQAVLDRVREVDSEHRTRLGPHKAGTIVVAHDAWSRLAERYNFKTVAIKGMLATEPTPQSIRTAVNAIREHNAKIIFTEPQLSKTTSRRIADAAGAKLMELDPLGTGDWFVLMRSNLDNIVAAFEAQRTPNPTSPPATAPPK